LAIKNLSVSEHTGANKRNSCLRAVIRRRGITNNGSLYWVRDLGKYLPQD
jgi:hypothetical protein